MIDTIVFLVAGAVCVVGALGVVIARNPVHSALMLVMTLFGIAVLFVAQEAHFLAVVQVIVYAGAIVVLFLFVIMLLGVDKTQRLELRSVRSQTVAAGIFAVAMLALLVGVGVATDNPATGAKAVGGALDTGAEVVRAVAARATAASASTVLLRHRADVRPARHRRRSARFVLVRRPRSDADERADPTTGPTVHAAERPDSMTAPWEVTHNWYLVLGALLFTIGGVGLLIRRNPLVMLMCVELMLNGVNLTFVTFSRIARTTSAARRSCSSCSSWRPLRSSSGSA